MNRARRLFCLLTAAVALNMQVAAPADELRHVVHSRSPAGDWERGFMTGNGRMGAILFGKPGAETLIANHCRLFLPLGNREIVPDLAEFVPQLRQLYREKGANTAQGFILRKAKDQGFPGITATDPFHPGFFIQINQVPEGPVSDYQRTEDFQTGEVTSRWNDARGSFERRLFVSRTDNMIVLSIAGPGDCEIVFQPIDHKAIESYQHVTTDWVGFHNIYRNGKGGYDAGIRIVAKGGKTDVAGEKVTVSGAEKILLLMRIVPWKTPLPKAHSEAWAYSLDNPDFQSPGSFVPAPPLAASSVVAYLKNEDSAELLPALKRSLARESVEDHQRLFESHAKAHRALFDRVTLDLNGGPDRMKPAEELLNQAVREKRLPAALAEKMYDAGRYMFICCAGELPPNLHGIWTGTWTPSWSGDFTLDTNVQAAMASACSGNLAELMEGYFRCMEDFYPEWRLNARRMYGCRGVLTNARASNTALMLHWGPWAGNFWTAGCGWLASFFTQYADYTGDRDFLAKRCLPLLKETAEFYEDFLGPSNADGKLQFIPSYNPETDGAVYTDATMDIAVAREILSDLIRLSRSSRTEEAHIPKWENLLARLPDYPINDGALTDWPTGGVAGKHRHHSLLYGCFQSFDPLFETNAVLRQAAQTTVRLKIAGADGGGQESSFGRIQCGVSAAYLGMPEEAYGRLEVMATKRSMFPSLITSHDPYQAKFNTDGNGGIPQIIASMLLFSRPGVITLLPSLPKEWPAGNVRGLCARGGLQVDMSWHDGKLTRAVVTASSGGPFKVCCGAMTNDIELKPGASISLGPALEPQP